MVKLRQNQIIKTFTLLPLTTILSIANQVLVNNYQFIGWEITSIIVVITCVILALKRLITDAAIITWGTTLTTTLLILQVLNIINNFMIQVITPILTTHLTSAIIEKISLGSNPFFIPHEVAAPINSDLKPYIFNIAE